MQFKDILDKFILDKDMLVLLGFKFDNEDYLWYDEHPRRHRYRYRLKPCFNGGYILYTGTKRIEKVKTIMELRLQMYSYDHSKLLFL